MSDKAVGRIRYVGITCPLFTANREYSLVLDDCGDHYIRDDNSHPIFSILTDFPVLDFRFEHVAPTLAQADGSADEVHLGAGIFVTQADHAALQQMEKANNICLCGRFVGRARLDAGLPDCTYCSAAAVRKHAVEQKLVRRGLDLEKANKIAFAGLTAHLREVKVL